ncbi:MULTISPECIES: DUF1127 domain-containing protein [Microvirga]|uniref:DUF1127 domain-containing protein n=1 Tax=Microvirga TaxID=186650 RepID=UPI001CFD3933|nr:DUF1127 domain-containing protein [Microvirga lenta]MCB5174116.1 DUF1127 domain-containing protein [Microvirga lenta]
MSLSMTREAAPRLAGSRERKGPGLLSRLAALVMSEIRARRDMRLLASLDDAALHDIGLARGEVEGVVRYGRSWKSEQPAPDESTGAVLPPSLTEWR